MGFMQIIHAHIGELKKQDQRIVILFDTLTHEPVTLAFESYVTQSDLKRGLGHRLSTTVRFAVHWRRRRRVYRVVLSVLILEKTALARAFQR